MHPGKWEEFSIGISCGINVLEIFLPKRCKILFLACDKNIYTGTTGRILYPRLQSQKVNDEYLPSLSCYFKIAVSPGKRVRIKFDEFDFQEGIDSGIILNSPGNKTVIIIRGRPKTMLTRGGR